MIFAKTGGGPSPNEVAFVIIGILIGVACAYLVRRIHQRRRMDARSDAHGRTAVDQERRRIAQELHDTVGHGLLVMVLQARRLSSNEPHLESVSNVIDATARSALDDLRRTVGVLRGSDGIVEKIEAEELECPLSVGVRRLIARVPECELSIELDVYGVESEVPDELHAAVLRVVQEGLTNAVKHGGSRSVRIDLRFDQYLTIAVVSVGAPAPEVGGIGVEGGGVGLVSLRELVESYGGTFECGPMPDGSFRLVARFCVAETRGHDDVGMGMRMPRVA